MSVKLEPGTYDGTTKAATLYEAPSGAVMARMIIDIDGVEMTGGICLIQKDGTLSERGFKDVRSIFGWSDWDWNKWDAPPETLAGAAVKVVIETVQGDKGEFSSVKYINPPSNGHTLERGNAKALAAKYGSKVRALMGGAPSATAPARPPAPRPPQPPKPAPGPVRTGTMEEAWEAFCKHPLADGKSEPDLYAAWEKLLDEKVGKRQYLTPAEWGKVLSDLDSIPF